MANQSTPMFVDDIRELFKQEEKFANYRYPVVEIFPAIQGEGFLTGRRTIFIRLGGCDYRCSWSLDETESVLLATGETKPVLNVAPGDVLLGGEAKTATYRPSRSYLGRHYVPTQVLEIDRALLPTSLVEFEDGRTLRVGPEHQFYTAYYPAETRKKSRSIGVKRLRPGHHVRALAPWKVSPWGSLMTSWNAASKWAQSDMAVVKQVIHDPPGQERRVVAIKTDNGAYMSANGVMNRNCDSLYAVLPEYRDTWKRMSVDDIAQELRETPWGRTIRHITLSGGNPAIHPLGPLLYQFENLGYTVAIETQGTVGAQYSAHIQHVTLSPKPPSAGNKQMDFNKLNEWVEQVEDLYLNGSYDPLYHTQHICTKVVVFDDQDWEFAKEIYEFFYANLDFPNKSFYIQVGTPQLKNTTEVVIRDMLILRMKDFQTRFMSRLADMPDAHIGMQQHTLLHGLKRGV